MRNGEKKRTNGRFSLALLAVIWIASGPLFALIGETPTVHAVAVADNPVNPEWEQAILLAQAGDGSYQVIIRQIQKTDGKVPPAPTIVSAMVRAMPKEPVSNDLVITLPEGVIPADVMYSRILQPGSVMVLDQTLKVREYHVDYDANGLPKLIGDTPTIHGPFGDPALVGFATAFAEAPGVIDPKIDGLVVIGTSSGFVVVILQSPAVPPKIDSIHVGSGPVSGVAAVRQVGYFGFVAVTGGRAVGINPDEDAEAEGLQAAIVFDLADPRPDPLLDLTGAVFEPNDEPLTDPQPVPLLVANGTRNVAIMNIPADPGAATHLELGAVDPKIDGIRAVAVGSLMMLPTSGESLLYEPGFTIEGGFLGPVYTIFGETLEVFPRTIHLGSDGLWISAVIEIANDDAEQIDGQTITLSAGGSAVPVAPEFTPQLGDRDSDGNADLLAKFDRAAVHAILDAALPPEVQDGVVRMEASWTYLDGSTGSASVDVRVTR